MGNTMSNEFKIDSEMPLISSQEYGGYDSKTMSAVAPHR